MLHTLGGSILIRGPSGFQERNVRAARRTVGTVGVMAWQKFVKFDRVDAPPKGAARVARCCRTSHYLTQQVP